MKYEEYKGRMFSQEGYDILFTYTKSLIKEYIKKQPNEYPFNLGVVFGVPYFPNHYSMYFNNKDELLGRIQGYMQLLMMNTIEIDQNGAKIIFELPKIEVKNGI